MFHIILKYFQELIYVLSDLSITLGVGSGAMVLILALSTMIILQELKKRRKQRQRFFKQNRGQLLQQLVCQRADIAERMIGTEEELERATNNFDKARKLGGGGHSTFYKGIFIKPTCCGN